MVDIIRKDVVVDVKGKGYLRREIDDVHVWYYLPGLDGDYGLKPCESKLAQILEYMYTFFTGAFR